MLTHLLFLNLDKVNLTDFSDKHVFMNPPLCSTHIDMCIFHVKLQLLLNSFPSPLN